MDPPAVASRRPWETLRFGPRRVVLPPHVEFTTTLRPASSPSCAVPTSEICRVCCPPPTFRFAKHPPREDRRFAAPVHPPRVGRPPTRRLVARRSRRACGHCSSFHDVGTNTPVARRRTARRYAAALSGSCDPQRPCRGQHHRLVRPEQVTWVCKSCGPRFIARRLRRSLPVDRCTRPNAGRRTRGVARRASPVVGRLVARRRSTTTKAQPDAHGTQVAARGPWFVARCPHHAARHPSFVVRSPLFVVCWPKSCSRVYSVITRRFVALGSNGSPICCRSERVVRSTAPRARPASSACSTGNEHDGRLRLTPAVASRRRPSPRRGL